MLMSVQHINSTKVYIFVRTETAGVAMSARFVPVVFSSHERSYVKTDVGHFLLEEMLRHEQPRSVETIADTRRAICVLEDSISDIEMDLLNEFLMVEDMEISAFVSSGTTYLSKLRKCREQMTEF